MIKDEGREVNSPLKFLVCGVYLIIILYITVSYFLNVDGIRDASGGDLIGRDFINFWTGGRAVFESKVSYYTTEVCIESFYWTILVRL